MASIPTSPGFRRVTLRKNYAISMAKSPVSFAQQLQDRGGEEWVADFELPPLSESDATTWITWLLAQKGMYNTFSLDVSDYDGGASGETTTSFRLAANDTPWTVADAMTFGIKFSAFQAQ